MKTNERTLGTGLSLIEVLILLAVLSVLAAFTSTALRDHSARAAVKEATVQLALALHNAKNLARANNTTVTVLFTTNPTHNSISYELPKNNTGSSGKVSLPVGITLPDTVSVSSAARALTFNPQGMVNATATIELAAASGTDFFAQVMLNPLQGRVKTSYGLQWKQI